MRTEFRIALHEVSTQLAGFRAVFEKSDMSSFRVLAAHLGTVSDGVPANALALSAVFDALLYRR